ncbi:MAG: Holliday junction resolvase RuvX [Schleiferiaceae bacterium]|nr:Holliday junction resolvase RuvX [Schleiferiaceae bacterium]
MAKIIALDIGGKRTGLAETDPYQIIASPLYAIPTEEIVKELQKLFANEDYESIVVGLPLNLQGEAAESAPIIEAVVNQLKETFPNIPLFRIDERFTSKMAVQSMVAGGMSKKNRRVKGNIDKVSAAIILQSFLESQR